MVICEICDPWRAIVVGVVELDINEDSLGSTAEFGEGVGASSKLMILAAVGFDDQVD